MELDIIPSERRAALDGRDLAIGARAFDVLAFLHAHRDRVVAKTELLDHVWSGLLVEESNLSVQIAGLRKVLGRDAIRTVPGIGYQLTLGTPAPQAPADPPPVPDRPSLAVLPFANLTGTPDQDYLVDGIVGEITAALSRIPAFLVISTTSSFTYRGRSVDLGRVGQELGVRYVMEGSIQQAGARLRIFAQVVEAETGHMLWSERFDGSDADIFELQDAVAEQVAGALEPTMIWAESARARAKPTDSLSAYDLCLRAAPMVYRQNSLADLTEAMTLTRQAMDLDPDYIQAKALFAYAHTCALATRWWTYEQAIAAVPQAYEVLESPTADALALTYCGHYVAYVERDRARGREALERAARLNPNSATTAMMLGWVCNYADDSTSALPHFERVLRISPLHPQIGVTTCGIGMAQMQRGDFEAAAEAYELAMSQYPEFATIQMGLLCVYVRLDRMEEAARLADWLRAKVPNLSVARFLRTTPHTSPLHHELMVTALRAFDFPEDDLA
ncbi:winged helix-turn-helix domain-containing protein [Jannaschia sp. M317]|uniref:winged helix-turn-helix domain-containing protein n=1 Tax=Jannaschia sp. M317 TaxID=2867011 RepID=UPI0021A79F33|nr:winged helix-turn-helix domain-containing protein [Jannaschia sp. M317]UWQ18249.1 winged helix-turn-helix domain-containing protein [Jannaschia sp. M317]